YPTRSVVEGPPRQGGAEGPQRHLAVEDRPSGAAPRPSDRAHSTYLSRVMRDRVSDTKNHIRNGSSQGYNRIYPCDSLAWLQEGATHDQQPTSRCREDVRS